MKGLRGVCVGALLLLTWSCSSALTPRQDWRIVPVDIVVDAESEDLLEAMADRRDGRVSGGGRVSVHIALPASDRDAMLTFERHPRGPRTPSSSWSASIVDGPRAREVARGGTFRGGLERVIIPPRTAPTQLEVVFEGRKLDIHNIGLYELDGQTDDIWLAVGASIQEGGMSHTIFKETVAAEFGYDPVVFNRAVSGWTAGKLRRRLPALLADHPEARYVAIHIGGNDVSVQRPYPGGADKLEGQLEAIVAMVRDAGRVPILARLSYRQYRKPPAVPPEDNGAGPYVEAVYDPMIARMTPAFSTFWGCGVVDPYSWYRDHPEELAPDGIHPNRAGRKSWARLWALQAGEVVY